MCSIPGLPTAGTELPILITRVSPKPNCGLVELWVNMDDGKKHIYEQMRKDIQSPGRKFHGSEGKPEDLCLVHIVDTWHRAQIVSIQDENYSVFLIDQGKLDITKGEALAWGQSDAFLLPPEIEKCILANVVSVENNWPERAAKFLNSLAGKKCKGLVQQILMPARIILLEIPVVSKHMCKCGSAKKIPGDEFKNLVLKCLQLPSADVEPYRILRDRNLNGSCILEECHRYFYPELLMDTFDTVVVTEINDPQNIFCKLLIFSKALNVLSEQIHRHYEESSDFGQPPPRTCGDPCAVKSVNGRWHRSMLKQNITTDGAVEVLHVDEGRTELVQYGNIKPLNGKFLRMPVVTYRCSLDGVKNTSAVWTADQTNYLKSLLHHRTVVARFNHYDITQDVYSVTLYADNAVCINSYFMVKVGLPYLSNENDSSSSNGSIPSFFRSHGTEQYMHEQNKSTSFGLCEKMLPSPKNQEVNGRIDDIPISDHLGSKDTLNGPNQLVQSTEHLSRSFPSKMENAHNGHVFSVGSSVDVHISCIESIQKFWCQTTESAESLRKLMHELQNHYAVIHPQSLAESICAAYNPHDDKWYRAKIIANSHSPLVAVRFIDYGQTEKVPLRNVKPIDPAFLKLNAQAFQCCLLNSKSSANPITLAWTDSALDEFRTFADSSNLSNTGLKCVVKAVTCDEEGLQLNMVDIETPSQSACELLTQRCVETDTQVPILPQVPSNVFTYSTFDIEVGGRENVFVTCSENVNNFYCQLDKNSDLLAGVMENVDQLKCSDHPLGLDSICFAKGTDNKWYRGQVVERSPKLLVYFVDYGHTLELNDTDICPIPTEASLARSAPVQAVQLGLFNVPEDVPSEVNEWFNNHVIGHSFTISVISKGAEGKLIVELLDGSLNLNVKSRERISQMALERSTTCVESEQQCPGSAKCTNIPKEDSLMQELVNTLIAMKTTGQNINNSKRVCAGDELNSSQDKFIKYEKTVVEGRKLNVILEEGPGLSETVHNDSDVLQLSFPCREGNTNILTYKKPNVALNKAEEVYASCIVGPHYFWCQYSNTKDLNMVSTLSQEVVQASQDMLFTKNLDPGSPCLALYSSDNQWYRAQVIHIADNMLHVLFIDYGNESDVDINNVRPLPECLLDVAPQAFLCSLNGFDESKGSWNDDTYDDFYALLVDKPLRVEVVDMKENLEIMAPEYAVQIECENGIVNDAMLKYWKPAVTENLIEIPTEKSLQSKETEFNMTPPRFSERNVTSCKHKNSNMSEKKEVEVYASCIVDPHFFWCQYANMEELKKVSRLAQEAGQAQQDSMFLKTLDPGSPCLALFSCDNQWYRAQVINRTDSLLKVVFIDYGNESDVDIKHVRPLPQSLLNIAPQALLCCLNGFDESQGSWDDKVYDDFYNLLVDKPLTLTVFTRHSDVGLPQYSVEIECEGAILNTLMENYWK
ncbi:tudor domain-containing 6 [Antennarius striatus]|uniref:tudor domain-containing 6 n=1 Tax=Antennarius striatus TaxID=241820 RepID=UPI0035B0A7BD